MLDDFIKSLQASQGGNLQMPVMGDPLRYINPYYTRQQAGNGLAPMQAYQALMQGRQMPQMQGWTPFQAPKMPTIGINTAVKAAAKPVANGLMGGYIGAGGFGGVDGMGDASSAGMGGASEGSAGSTAATASSPDGPDGSNASAGDGGGSK